MAMSILSAFALCIAVAMATGGPGDNKSSGGASQQASNSYNWHQYVPSMAPPANNSYNWQQYVPSATGFGPGSSGSHMNFSQYIPAGVAKFIPSAARGQGTSALAQSYASAKGPQEATSAKELCAWRAGQMLYSDYIPKEYSGGFRFGLDKEVEAGMKHLNNISNGAITSANCSGTIFKFDSHPAEQNAANCTSKSELDAWYKQTVAMIKEVVPSQGRQFALASVKAEYEKNLRRIQDPAATPAPTAGATTEAPPPPPAASNMVQASPKKTPLAFAAASVGSPDAVSETQFFAIFGVVAFALTAGAGVWLQVRRGRLPVSAEVALYDELL